jgi:hypothetical protein
MMAVSFIQMLLCSKTKYESPTWYNEFGLWSLSELSEWLADDSGTTWQQPHIYLMLSV